MHYSQSIQLSFEYIPALQNYWTAYVLIEPLP